MIGTAIRKYFGLIARAVRGGVGGGRAVKRPHRSQHGSRAHGSSLFRAAPRGLTGFLVVAFVLGSIVGGPAAHRWLDANSEQAVNVQAVSQVAKSAVGDETPVKGAIGGLCTGHCTSHAVALPAVSMAAAMPLPKRAAWPLAHDQWTQASAPAGLERPPRV